MSHHIRQARQYAEVLQRDMTDFGPTPVPTPRPVYGMELQREMADLGPTSVPTTRPVYGMERIPVFPPRQVTGGLRLPTKGKGKTKQAKEVFDDEFYDLFPWASGVAPSTSLEPNGSQQNGTWKMRSNSAMGYHPTRL